MKKYITLLALLSAFGGMQSFAESVDISESGPWTQANTLDLNFVGNDILFYRVGTRDYQNRTINISSYTGNAIEMRPTASSNGKLGLWGTLNITGTGGDFTLKALDEGGEYYGEIAISNISVSKATLNLAGTDRSIYTTAGNSKITLDNNSVLNLDIAGKNTTNEAALTIQANTKNEVINFVGSRNEYRNIYFSGVSSIANGYAINLNTSASDVTFKYDTTDGQISRGYINANSKNVTLDSSTTITFTASRYTKFNSLVFTGSGEYGLNTVILEGNADSTISFNGTGKIVLQGSNIFRNNTVIASSQNIQFGAASSNPSVVSVSEGKTITIADSVNNAVINDTATSDKANGSFRLGANSTLIINRGLSVVAAPDMRLNNKSKLVLNKDSDLSGFGFNVVGSYISASTSYEAASATFGVGAEITMDFFNFMNTSGSGELNLEFSNAGLLNLGSVKNLENGFVFIDSEIYHQFKIYNVDDINKYETYFGTSSVDGVAFEKISDGVYWVNTAIPEPAEWAAIFGALALGLAIYRRRK